MSAAPTSPGVPSAERVGRGALLISAAKLWFMVTGAVVNFALGSLLGDADYGNYGVTIRWISLLNMMVVQGLMQGMSRAVSAQPHAARTLWNSAKPVAWGTGIATALLVVVVADPLATFFGDAALAPGLRAAALIPAAYGLYSAQVGVLNGLQRFKQQAWLDMAFSTAKLLGILGAAALGLGVAGSVLGFGAAAVVVAAATALALRGIPQEAAATPLSARALLGFSGAVMVYQASLNLLMFVDLGMVKRLTPSSDMAGHYNAAVNLAQLPYLLCTAVTFVVFPLLGRELDAEKSRQTTRQALRYALLVGAPVAAAMAACAPGMLGAVFPPTYRAAAPALQVLCVSYVGTALLSVSAVMLNALGRPAVSAACVLAGVATSAGMAPWLIGQYGLRGAAWGSLAGTTVSLALTWHALLRTGRAAIPWRSLLRHALVLAVACVVGAPLDWPVGGWGARALGLLGGAAAGVAAWGLLVLLGEVGRPEWELLGRVLGRRPAKP